VTKFRYLGRILSQDDSDLSACVRNIQRATLQWAAVSKVLKREGVSKESFARLYKVIVSTVLLYGSDTWVVTRRMEELLTSSTTDASGTLRDVSSDVPMPSMILGYAVDDWSSGGSLQLKLHPAMHYVRARRTGLLVCQYPTHLPTMPHFDPTFAS
jgi:hypothetical protein